jgi:hypothetical protein
LRQLYGVDERWPICIALRRLWERDPAGRPMLALLCALARDPPLRDGAAAVLDAFLGERVRWPAIAAAFEARSPGRLGEEMAKSLAQHAASTWTQGGFLKGRVRKERIRAKPTPPAASYYHANLERLAYTVLGDWIARLGDDPRAEAARILQDKLALILEGEKPHDVFVRWKPIERQPLGWNPDLDDGVRLNIRPFVEARVLAHVPNVKYTVDRGKDVASAPWYHLFKGERRNDHHTTLAQKRAARSQAAQ